MILRFPIMVMAAAIVFASPAQAQSAPHLRAREAAVIQNLLETPAEEIDLAVAKLTIDQLVDPSIDIAASLVEIETMAEVIRATLSENANDQDVMAAIRRHIYEPGPWNGDRPFAYDHDDPLGAYIPNKLIPTYLETRLGNCISMPFLVILLGDRLGLDVTAATAPLHVFVKFTDRDMGVALNLEATSGAHPARDSWYRQNLPMTEAAIANGVYMRPLTRIETVALMATVVLERLIEKGRYEDAIDVSSVILNAYPTHVYALAKRGTAFALLLERDIYERYPDSRLPAEEAALYEYLVRGNATAFSDAEAMGWEAFE